MKRDIPKKDKAMTQTSDAFMTSLNAVVRESMPVEAAQNFAIRLPLDDRKAHAFYTSLPFAKTNHEKIHHAAFLARLNQLFEEGEPGDLWMKEAQVISTPAEDFGFYTQAEIDENSFHTQTISSKNAQPTLTFQVNPDWKQVNHCTFVDGMLPKGQKSPVRCEFKILKKQAEFKRFLHLLSAFQGPMKLWRTYYFRTNVTLRAPDRASACFLTQALVNAKKAMKSDTYEVESAYRVFCNTVEPESVIDAYQADMKAISIL